MPRAREHHNRQGIIPQRAVRVPDDLWHTVKGTASDRGETVTAVVIRALIQYVNQKGKP